MAVEAKLDVVESELISQFLVTMSDRAASQQGSR